MKKIGLIPAAGTADRIAPLPCSKELYPIGFQSIGAGCGVRPKVVSQYLLEKMRIANIAEVYIVLRKGKWDIPEYFGDGKALNMHLAYLIMDLPFGVPYTLEQAYPFIKDAIIIFGFPDIIFQPDDAFASLLAKQAESKADVVLGLFPAHQSHKSDMVELDGGGRVRGIRIKPSQTSLHYTWIIAVWTSAFTHFMHDYVLTRPEIVLRDGAGNMASAPHELYIGDVIQVALENDIRLESVIFSNGRHIDIGTPENLLDAVSSELRQTIK